MRQAIATRYIGPTDCRGSRVKATAQAGSITIGWDDALGIDENHAAAALALCAKFGWKGRMFGGGAPDGRGNVFVFAMEGTDYCINTTTGPKDLARKARKARSGGR